MATHMPKHPAPSGCSDRLGNRTEGTQKGFHTLRYQFKVRESIIGRSLPPFLGSRKYLE